MSEHRNVFSGNISGGNFAPDGNVTSGNNSAINRDSIITNTPIQSAAKSQSQTKKNEIETNELSQSQLQVITDQLRKYKNQNKIKLCKKPNGIDLLGLSGYDALRLRDNVSSNGGSNLTSVSGLDPYPLNLGLHTLDALGARSLNSQNKSKNTSNPLKSINRGNLNSLLKLKNKITKNENSDDNGIENNKMMQQYFGNKNNLSSDGLKLDNLKLRSHGLDEISLNRLGPLGARSINSILTDRCNENKNKITKQSINKGCIQNNRGSGSLAMDSSLGALDSGGVKFNSNEFEQLLDVINYSESKRCLFDAIIEINALLSLLPKSDVLFSLLLQRIQIASDRLFGSFIIHPKFRPDWSSLSNAEQYFNEASDLGNDLLLQISQCEEKDINTVKPMGLAQLHNSSVWFFQKNSNNKKGGSKSVVSLPLRTYSTASKIERISIDGEIDNNGPKIYSPTHNTWKNGIICAENMNNINNINSINNNNNNNNNNSNNLNSNKKITQKRSFADAFECNNNNNNNNNSNNGNGFGFDLGLGLGADTSSRSVGFTFDNSNNNNNNNNNNSNDGNGFGSAFGFGSELGSPFGFSFDSNNNNNNNNNSNNNNGFTLPLESPLGTGLGVSSHTAAVGFTFSAQNEDDYDDCQLNSPPAKRRRLSKR